MSLSSLFSKDSSFLFCFLRIPNQVDCTYKFILVLIEYVQFVRERLKDFERALNQHSSFRVRKKSFRILKWTIDWQFVVYSTYRTYSLLIGLVHVFLVRTYRRPICNKNRRSRVQQEARSMCVIIIIVLKSKRKLFYSLPVGENIFVRKAITQD